MFKPTRRGFMVGCSAAIAAMAGSRLNYLAFGGTGGSAPNDVLVYVFLRGGMDGLSLVPPIDGPDRGFYEAARPSLRIPMTGDNAAIDLDGQFGLHPSAASLAPLFQEGKLAIVMGTGMSEPNRSHFDAQEFIELGTPGSKSSSTGWLSRHLSSVSDLPDDAVMPSLALGQHQPVSLAGSLETLALENPNRFGLDTGHYRWKDAQRVALRRLYEARSSILHLSGLQALNAIDVMEAYVTDDYEPSNEAEYPRGSFGDRMRTIAQLVKLQLGLTVATVDVGGWDTHENQGNRPGQYFANLIRDLSAGLAALYTDLSGPEGHSNRLTIVVQSEFGRRLRENADSGTDHGVGNPMLVLGGSVNGGILGQWPGLHPDQLFDGVDVGVSTDFRRVLAEIVTRRLGNPRIDQVFPGYSGFEPMNLVEPRADVEPPPPKSSGGIGFRS